MSGDVITIVRWFLTGFLSSTAGVLVLFIGFCVFLGFTKLKRTAGNTAVVKSLDETITHKTFVYLPPSAPRGPADQLHTPELREAAARR